MIEKLLCVNNRNRPNEIPQSKWDLLKEGELYTPVKWMRCNAQGGILGVKIAEIDLSDCQPYIYFAAYRFAIPVGDRILEEVETELIEV